MNIPLVLSRKSYTWSEAGLLKHCDGLATTLMHWEVLSLLSFMLGLAGGELQRRRGDSMPL